MNGYVDEELFYESLEQFSTEYREEVLKRLKQHNEEYRNLRNEFGSILDRTERLAETLHKEDKQLLDRFIEVYFAIVMIESNHLYLQGQFDGMRLMKKLNGYNNGN